MSEIFGQSSDEVTELSSIESENTTVNVTNEKTLTNETKLINATLNDKLLSISEISEQDAHILEYSQEHGFLKLSHRVRKKLLVPVHLITINPDDSACFGGTLDKFFVQYVLGYDDVLLLSLKLLAEKQNYKGYVRNVVTGSEYVFVNIWMDQKSYLTAAFSMFLFTASVSLLLRHSDHQIFVFIVEVLHMLEFHSFIHFPAAPLLTVILALVGLEAVLSEFFQDTAAAFHVILVVWMADQYRTVCCSNPTAKKHWTRFFLLYHFFFYGYTFRFGHNLYLAFFTSCLFIFHSMIYFYHRYELPLLINRELNSSNTSNGDPSNHAPEPSLDRNDDQETIPDNHSSETESEPAHTIISQGTSNQPQNTEDLNVTNLTTLNNSLVKRHKSMHSADISLTKDVIETFSVPKEKSIEFLKTITKQIVEDSSLRNCI